MTLTKSQRFLLEALSRPGAHLRYEEVQMRTLVFTGQKAVIHEPRAHTIESCRLRGWISRGYADSLKSISTITPLGLKVLAEVKRKEQGNGQAKS